MNRVYDLNNDLAGLSGTIPLDSNARILIQGILGELEATDLDRS